MVNNIIHDILKDIKVKALDEFDMNFDCGGFFKSNQWKESKMPNQRGSTMQRTGRLRRSISARVTSNSVVFSSNVPYAGIHNDGGTMIVTAKMKRFFWAKYYELMGRPRFSIKTHKAVKTAKRRIPQAEAYKAMALMKVGSKIVIPQRQFVGTHQHLEETIEIIAKEHIEAHIKSLFKQR